MKKIIVFLLTLSIGYSTQAQDFGLSFSYFIPKNGYVSTPVSPFSIRGLGVNINRFVSIETGISLYRMSGLQLVDLPFESKEPIVGPNFTAFVPLELVFSLKGNKTEFDLKGGGFVFVPFANKINYGNLDRAIRAYENWTVANATADLSATAGFGWMAGAELTIYVTPTVGISLETNYLAGNAKSPLKGSYTGGNDTTFETVDFDYNKAKTDLTGLEFSIGVIMSSGGGKPKPRKRR